MIKSCSMSISDGMYADLLFEISLVQERVDKRTR